MDSPTPAAEGIEPLTFENLALSETLNDGETKTGEEDGDQEVAK